MQLKHSTAHTGCERGGGGGGWMGGYCVFHYVQLFLIYIAMMFNLQELATIFPPEIQRLPQKISEKEENDNALH